MSRTVSILGALVLVIVAASGSSAGAAPVAIQDDVVTVESTIARLSSIGRQVLPVRGGFLVVSDADLGLTSVGFVAEPAATVSSDLVLLGPLAAQGNRLVGVDAAGEAAVAQELVDDPLAPVLRLFRTPQAAGSPFEQTGVAVLPEEIRSTVRRFGTSIAIGGNAIAVVSETTAGSDRIDIFRLSLDGTAEWSQELSPQTLDTVVAISTSGATIVASGVNRLAASGEVIVNRIGPDGWVPTQRFLRIGGGPVVMDNDRILVQRNSFFARASGPWTIIDSAPGRPFEVVAELPVEGSSLSAASGVILVGDAENNVAYLLEEVGSTFRFSQAIRPPRTGPGSDSPLFGSAVAVLPGQRVVIGAPGPGPLSAGGEVHVLSVTDGPVGCTIVGTDGPDELTSPASPSGQIVCGLAGNDVIVGTNPSDVLLGGPGDDTLTGAPVGGIVNGGFGSDQCQQAGPASAPITVIDCET